jgi:hypothetical protein
MSAKYATGGVFGKLVQDPHFWAPAVALGAGAAVTGVASAIKRVTDARERAVSYKEMLDITPQLKKRDPVLVRRIYSSLHNVNPIMASDPMVAGAWVDTIVDSAGLDQSQAGRALLEAVGEMAQVRSHLSKAKHEESSGPRAIGAAVSSQIQHGFGRAKELEKEIGDLGAKDKQINELQGKLKFKGIQDSATEVERFNRAAGQNPAAAQKIMNAILKKYSSEPSAGQRLLAAVR